MKHMGDYSILAALSAIYLVVVFRYQTTPKYIMMATVVFGVVYLVWGVFHQIHARNFHTKIMLEYFLVALMGVAIISTLLI